MIRTRNKKQLDNILIFIETQMLRETNPERYKLLQKQYIEYTNRKNKIK